MHEKAYGDAEERAKAIELAEEMLAASAIHEEEEKWQSARVMYIYRTG
ncbi:MAG: hypothetical protein JRJ51_21780 [Deltaproteobacteria bacterium]|nr:hypothetical protein [Deltaproteobacteria bacterium]